MTHIRSIAWLLALWAWFAQVSSAQAQFVTFSVDLTITDSLGTGVPGQPFTIDFITNTPPTIATVVDTTDASGTYLNIVPIPLVSGGLAVFSTFDCVGGVVSDTIPLIPVSFRCCLLL